MSSDAYAAALGLKPAKPSSLAPGAAVLTPAEDAASNAMERSMGDAGFDAAYAKASPADRADLMRSRMMSVDPANPYAMALGVAPKPSGAAPRTVAPASPPGQASPGQATAAAPPAPSFLDKATGTVQAGMHVVADTIDGLGGYVGTLGGTLGGLAGALKTKLSGGVQPDDPRVLAVTGDNRPRTWASGEVSQPVTAIDEAGAQGAQTAISALHSGPTIPLTNPLGRDYANTIEGGLQTLASAYPMGPTPEMNAATASLPAAVATARASPVGQAVANAKLSSLVRPSAMPPALRIEPTMPSQLPAPPLSVAQPELARVGVSDPAVPAAPSVAPAAPAPVDLALQPTVPVPARSPGFPGAEPAPSGAAPISAAAAAGSAPETPPGYLDPSLQTPPASSASATAARQAANAPTISDPSNGVFAESNPDVAGGLPQAEQARRAAVLRAIGLDRVRASAVTGDAGAASTDFQTSRLDSPAGLEMRNAIAGEKAAITNYAENIAQNTGGSAMNDQAAKLARGNTIVAPLDAMKQYFDDQTSALYQTADARAQGVPTQLDNFRTALGDDSMLTNSDRVHLQSGVNAYARKLGIMDDDGNVFANAQQAETMRKYLNENWSPQNSGMVGKLKDALDDDVTSAAGEDVYAQARAMRAQRAATLDNPNGIANLMDASGPNSINRKVPIERIADTVTSMPVAQLGHVVDTLKNAPDAIQPQAQAALAEIKAQYAHNVVDIGSKQAGQWNAKGVRQYLANNSARMAQVFEPNEMQQFGTLNDAGNILAKDQTYPGAFAQQQNLLRAGVAHGITTGMAGAGGAIGGAPGAALGSILGNKLAGKFNDAATLRATQKRMTKLSDLVPRQDPQE